MCHDGRTFQTSDAIANAFSQYFSSISAKSGQSCLNDKRHSLQSFHVFPTCSAEVRNTILSLKTTRAELDNISARYMDMVDVIAPIFAHIVNLIFKHSIFPSELKKSKIVPVHKKADKSLLNN